MFFLEKIQVKAAYYIPLLKWILEHLGKYTSELCFLKYTKKKRNYQVIKTDLYLDVGVSISERGNESFLGCCLYDNTYWVIKLKLSLDYKYLYWVSVIIINKYE